MECKSVQKSLADYVVGAVHEDVKKQMDAHLQTCESCRFEFLFLQKTPSGIRGLPQVEPPEWLWNKIEGKLYEEKKSWLGLPQIFLRPALAFTFALLLLGLSYWKFFTPTHAPQVAVNMKTLMVTESTFHASPFMEQHYMTESENPAAQDAYLAMLYEGEK